MNIEKQELKELFRLVDEIGNKRYNRLTHRDLEIYKRFDYWRYVNGVYECGTTEESREWVRDHSDWDCPICGKSYRERGGREIDHKLPRSQYPWLSMEFKNFWVICHACNREKGEMHWYTYERYVLVKYPDLYDAVKVARPNQLLQSLKDSSM